MATPSSYKDFIITLQLDAPPELWPESLKAMWWDACENWGASHLIAQEIPSEIGNWIHAYLHRKEGDNWNAGYWYQRAGRNFPTVGLEEESVQIVELILRG